MIVHFLDNYYIFHKIHNAAGKEYLYHLYVFLYPFHKNLHINYKQFLILYSKNPCLAVLLSWGLVVLIIDFFAGYFWFYNFIEVILFVIFAIVTISLDIITVNMFLKLIKVIK